MNCELPVKMAHTGIASEIKPTTIAAAFLYTAEKRASTPAMRVMREGREQQWTWT